jgi:tRNA pseudouridine38-40 synthase
MVVKLTLEYDGTRFCGWQLQPNAPSVQGALERAVATVLREPVRITAAGRTDAGVHARGQVAAFRTSRTPDLAALRRSLNSLAGPDIAVVAADAVGDGFDPRRDARSRAYAYYILNRSAPSPFWRQRAWHVPHRLDLEAMRAAAALLCGEHDFSSFCGPDCAARHAVRRTLTSRLEREADVLRYEIEASGFVRHMVRNIVGTLVEVGRGALDLPGFRAIIAARDRRRAGPTAPAWGLYLLRVSYD